jgi:molybdopterin synthase sulfur carrier subunit
MIRILYFAWVREQIGLAEEDLELAGPTSLLSLIERLRGRSAGHAAALADPARLRAAINQQFVALDAMVQAGDEVALFPPVTGG